MTTVTPLQEAMFASAIADNGGTLMKPYLIQQVTASDTEHRTAGRQQSVLSQAVSATVADNVKQMMIAVVQQPEGTAYGYRAGRSAPVCKWRPSHRRYRPSTAQNGTSASNSAMTRLSPHFAPYVNPKIAVGVIIQGGGYGATAAAPIAVAGHQGIPGSYDGAISERLSCWPAGTRLTGRIAAGGMGEVWRGSRISCSTGPVADQAAAHRAGRTTSQFREPGSGPRPGTRRQPVPSGHRALVLRLRREQLGVRRSLT